ncbi:MAG TPA: sialate O-acetylesterase [Planctomycetota bacterium]|nr:sialate O-acetylesterase [Planctomycetota bacterium]
MNRIFVSTLLALIAIPAFAEVKLASIFSDNIVLQRDKEVTIWGTADAGEAVTVKVKDVEKAATADDKGAWRVTIGPCPAGGPHEITISGKNTITLKNVLFGDVWVCSGQSNMEWPMRLTHRADEDIPKATHPQIRLFTAWHVVGATPFENFQSKSGWRECTPEQVKDFSAVAYYFAKQLNETQKVPIGLIGTHWGGTPAQSWASREALQTMPEYKAFFDNLDQIQTKLPELQKEFKEKEAEWKAAVANADAGSKDGKFIWQDVELDTKEWKAMKLPQAWETAGLAMDGIVWFRKEVEVPEGWAGKTLVLSLGPIDDFDHTFINGKEVGKTERYDTPRVYKIAADAFKPGKNIIAIRVNDTGGGGGIYGKPEQMKLQIEGDDASAISLATEWKYEIAQDSRKLPPKPKAPPAIDNAHSPSGLYNAMIHPIINYGIKGAIWYQGESNAGRADQYRELFPLMIKDWRARFKQGDFPFLFVQLANFMAVRDQAPVPSAWAELRESQLMTLSLPATGMAVIIDIGEEKDIHPRNKKDVGERLALWARANVYGEKLIYSGPLYKSMAIEGSKIRVKFDHVGGGLVSKDGGALKWFAIAGEDQKYVWAKAEIDGDSVLVSAEGVEKPVAVRYAWADNPAGCNLFNKEGLPASPFRTDNWKGK